MFALIARICGAQDAEEFRARHDNQPIELPREPGIFELVGDLSGEGLDLMPMRVMLAGSADMEVYEDVTT